MPTIIEGMPSARNNHCHPANLIAPDNRSMIEPDMGLPITPETAIADTNQAVRVARSLEGYHKVRAVLRLLYTIAAVPKPGGSILYGDGVEDFGDGLFQDHGGASFGGAEQLLQLRPGLLDRVEIG